MGLTFSRMEKVQDGADEDRRKRQPSASSEAAAEHAHKGRGLFSDNTHYGCSLLDAVPTELGCPRQNLQFPSQTESEDQRAGAD